MSSLPLWMVALAVVVALGLDRRWGEPPLRWHPVAWMGHYLMWVGDRIAPPVTASSSDAMDQRAFGLGAATWLAGAMFTTALGWGLQTAVMQTFDVSMAFIMQVLLLGVLLKPMLAWRMLTQEVQAVEIALQNGLAQGRERLRWICSRDTDALSEEQVRETAVESLAENLNDSVVAPVFWFVCFGLPGAVLYRFANTADAMWGYRGERGGRIWTWAGKWAAHADDVLSWLPARMTAFALMLVSGCTQWRDLRTQAHQTPSPNSGWPMAAMALSLNVRLGKPGVYVLHPNGLAASGDDVHRACAAADRTVMALVVALMVALLIDGALLTGCALWAGRRYV